MQTKELKEALRICAMVAPTRTPSEIYTYALIADGKMSASDGESYISTPIKSDLNVLIPIKTMQEICSGSSQDVSISLVGNNLKVKAGKSSYSLPTMNPLKFPKPTQLSEEITKVNGNALQEAIDLCLQTVDPLTIRGGVGGICLHTGAHGIRVMSMGHHGFSSMFISNEPTQRITESIPPKQMSILRSIANGTISIHYSGNCIVFVCGETVLVSPTVAGSYPISLFEKQFDTKLMDQQTVTIDMSDFTEAVRQVGIVLKMQSKLRMKMEGNVLSMKCEEDGSASESEICSVDGEGKWECLVSQHYLSKYIKPLNGNVELGRSYPIMFMKSGSKVLGISEIADA